MGFDNKRWAGSDWPNNAAASPPQPNPDRSFPIQRHEMLQAWTVYEIPSGGDGTVPPDPPGARSRARRAVALGVAGARNAARTSTDVISAAAGDASALGRAPPLVASSSVVPAASAAGHPGRHRPTPSRAPPPPAAPPRRGVPAPRDLGPSSAAGRLDLELGGPQRCNADRVRGLLQKPMVPSGSRLLPLW